MTYYCNECVVTWWPYQCINGACPECGGGTKRVQEPASDDADARHRVAMQARVARERSAHNHKLFEDYYARRTADAVNAAQDTDAIDSLELWAKLDTIDPEQQWGEAA